MKSIWGPGGPVGTVMKNGNREVAYDNTGKKLGESDQFGVRDAGGRPIIRQPLTGVLFGNSKPGDFRNKK